MGTLKTVYMRVVALVVMTLAAGTAVAQEVDLGYLQLDVPYVIRDDYKDYSARFYATTSGTLTVLSSPSPSLQPFADAEHTEMIDCAGEFLATGFSYSLKVEAGKTYYFFQSFSMNTNVVRLSMNNELELVSESVANGSLLSLSGRGALEYGFNMPPLFDEVVFEFEDFETNITASTVVNGSYLVIDLMSAIGAIIEANPQLVGTVCRVRISGLHSAIDSEILYGSDGILEREYLVAKMPGKLLSTNAQGFIFYSSFPEGTGIFRMTFDCELLPDTPVITLLYGNPESAEPGNFYVETVTDYTVETPGGDDGPCELVIDLATKERTPAMMVENGMLYSTITLNVANLMTTDGQYVYSGGYGTLGSFTYELPYKVVASGIDKVGADRRVATGVYNLMGVKILDSADDAAVSRLPEGFYVIDGKVVRIRN